MNIKNLPSKQDRMNAYAKRQARKRRKQKAKEEQEEQRDKKSLGKNHFIPGGFSVADTYTTKSKDKGEQKEELTTDNTGQHE
jgi:hypothetical protein